MTLADLNAAARDRFVTALGWIFEGSPWVAERAWAHRPFTSVDDLYKVMSAVVVTADRAEQLALLRAHPDLGTRATMSERSTAEQAGAGLDRLSPAEFDRLQQLNAAYRQKFGFPFLFAVKEATALEIIAALEQRLDAEADMEFAEALRQVLRIAGFRLREMFAT